MTPKLRRPAAALALALLAAPALPAACRRPDGFPGFLRSARGPRSRMGFRERAAR